MLKIWIFIPLAGLPRKSRYALWGVIYWRVGGCIWVCPLKQGSRYRAGGTGGSSPLSVAIFAICRLKVMLTFYFFIFLSRKSRYALWGVIYWGAIYWSVIYWGVISLSVAILRFVDSK
jgi:hypothetical protein